MERDTIIFDLDGTLLNTMGDLHAGFNYAIEKKGFAPRTIEEIQSFVGNGVVRAIELALPHKVDEATLNQILQYFKEYYKEHMHELTKPYSEIIDMLKELQQKEYKLGVVSNKYDEAVKKLCKKFFSEYIEVAIGEGDGIECKPNPMGVIKAAKLLNSDIKRVIYVGDSDTDILTAKNAKVPCISVLWGYKDKEFLINNGGKNFVTEPKEIINIIEKKLYLM